MQKTKVIYKQLNPGWFTEPYELYVFPSPSSSSSPSSLVCSLSSLSNLSHLSRISLSKVSHDQNDVSVMKGDKMPRFRVEVWDKDTLGKNFMYDLCSHAHFSLPVLQIKRSIVINKLS